MQTNAVATKHELESIRLELHNSQAEAQLLRSRSDQSDQTTKALTTQVSELKSQNESLETRLSSSFSKEDFSAMESQTKLKQKEIQRLNGLICNLKKENFTLSANSDNNQLKVNNLAEQLSKKE